MQIQCLDHVVLTVTAVDVSVGFYTRVLGMEHIETEGRHALRFGRQKINLHQIGHEFEPKAERPTPGSGDLCVITTAHLTDVAVRLTAEKVVIENGPVARTGALGPMRSLYIRDPDRNLIEIAVYNEPPSAITGHDRS